MQIRLQLLILFMSLTLFFTVLELIRRRSLRQEYSLIWLLSAIVVFILALFRGSVASIARLFQVEYPPSLIFIVGLVLIVAIQLGQALAISKLSRQNRDLAQKLSIHEWHLGRSRAQQDTTEALTAIFLSKDVEHAETESVGTGS